MSRFEQGRWNRILVWTGAALAWGSALIAGHLAPASAADAEASEPGQTENIGTQQAMPAPGQGLIVIRVGREQTDQPAVQLSLSPPAPASAPEIASSGS